MQISELLDFLGRLRKARIWHRLGQFRDNAIAVEVVVPGERWEIEFTAEGTVEVERFRSDGKIQGIEALDDLFANFSDED